MKNVKVITKSTNFFVKIIGIFLLIFSIMSIVQGFYGLKVSFSQGRFGINYELHPDKNSLVVTNLLKDHPAEKSGLKVHDQILMMNGKTIDEKNQHTVWGDELAGSQIVMTVQRGDQELELRMTRQLMPLIDRVIRILYLLILPLLMLAYVLVGLWGILKLPSYETKLIAMVCFLFGTFYTAVNLGVVNSPLTEYLKYYQVRGIVGTIGIFMAPAFWLFLFVNFPQKTGFYKKHKFTSILLIFSFPIAVIIFDFIKPDILQNFKYFALFLMVYLFVYIFFGITILSRSAKKEKGVLKRRQYKLILFGIRYGTLAIFTGFLCITIYSLYMQRWAEYFGWSALIIFLVTQIVGLILPFTFLNSFFQKNILKTLSALKRRLRYIGATFTLFIIYLIIAFLIGNWIISRYKLTDSSFIVLLILILALTFSPVNTRILRWLEQKLYPEKTKYRNLLKEYVKKLSGFIEESQILDNLSNWISETMGIYPVHAFSIDKIGQVKIPIKINSRKSVLKKIKDGSNFFWDEISEESNIQIEEEEKKWALKKGISITVPMISRGEQVGILNIGQKKNREDFTGDDLEIFQEAAYHSALTIQNVKLQAEHLEKKRLDKELEVARDIQTHLMPRNIPKVKGFQIDGKYIPCFEVGGDYFDIIPINENKTALVIADVSGKGAGAALLMSNLQASLKMAISVSLPLNDIVYRINNMIFKNSLPTQFITFFICLWDAKTKSLQYINSGHNPPLVIKNNNKIKKLFPTGMGLGIQKNEKFKSKKVSLSVEDILAIYTDGIEEFFNKKLEPFGLKRMIQIFQKNKNLHPSKILKILFQNLKNFSPNTPLQDDITIIVAKRI